MSDDNEIEVSKTLLTYKTRASKRGRQYYFNIPSEFIDSGMIEHGTKYRIYLKKLNKEEKD
jgi:hypothetical protein